MSLGQDLRFSFRSLRRNPALAATCLIVLALGIGANIAIFSAVKAILLDPLPYCDPGRLMELYEAGAFKGDVHDEVAPGNFYDWQRDSKSFADIAAYGDVNGNLSGQSGLLPEHLKGFFCSWNLFRTLGIRAAIGRTFAPSDDTPKAVRTVILSDSLWRRRFAADPHVAGQTLRLDAQLYTIIGVMPRTFEFPDATTQYWTPMQLALPSGELRTREDHRLSVIARLRPGVGIRRATSELTALQAQIARNYAGETGKSVEVYTLQSQTVAGSLRTSIFVLWAAVGCVLLIACINVANLLLTRDAARQREIAIRTALGASKGRIVRLFLCESLILSLAGAACGVILAECLIRLFVMIGASLPRASEIQLHWISLLFAVGLAIAVGIASGALPAASAFGFHLNQAIHETGRTTFGSTRRTWQRNALVSGEIALSFLLLIGAGLLLKSLILLQNVDVGFNTDRLLTMRITLPIAQYSTDAKAAAFFEQLLARVRALPGVRRAGLVSWLPVAGQFMNTDFTIEGQPKPLPSDFIIPRTADPGYFRAMGIPLERGHVFDPRERLTKADKAIVSRSLVRRYFAHEDPLGKYISFWDRRWQIIGIVGDVRKNLNEEPEPTVYIPISSGELNFAALAVRAHGDPLRLATPIEREIARLDPNLAVSDVLTMNQLISKRTADRHFTVVLLISFAGLAVLLAAVGLYGVVSYSTAQRTSEFGVRLALGAQPKNLIQSVLLEGLKPALIGMAIGLLASFAAVRVMQPMLFEVKPFDAAVFSSVACGLLLVSLIAGLIPGAEDNWHRSGASAARGIAIRAIWFSGAKFENRLLAPSSSQPLPGGPGSENASCVFTSLPSRDQRERY